MTMLQSTILPYDYMNNTTDRASGGTSILINKITRCRILLNTNLQPIAASATIHCTITVSSIYIPPHDQIIDAELDQLLQQLLRAFILMGDFNNSLNIIWGCKEINQKKVNLRKYHIRKQSMPTQYGHASIHKPIQWKYLCHRLKHMWPNYLYWLLLASIWTYLW